MTHTQYRALLAKLDLSQVAAANLVGADPRTGRRWALGERPIPACVAILLRLIAKGTITVADVEKAK